MPYRGKKNFSALEKKIIRLLGDRLPNDESWPTLSKKFGIGREKLYRIFRDQNYGVSWEDVSKLTKKLDVCLVIHCDKARLFEGKEIELATIIKQKEKKKKG